MIRSDAVRAALARSFIAWLLAMSGLTFAVANAQTPAAADPGAGAASPGMTHLHLAATGEVSVTPDELVASLAAEATSPSAAAAQNRVNALIKRGLEAAARAGVEARAEDYSVQQVDVAGHPAGRWRS